ncbi:hypothetical protein LTR09_002816 [Extremus antarcticus]|uniref:Uncharacterized protein n=1 Tax=Extremus antarcticus TaxID=702011 RepID=A0AAJ0GF48_9PEZI|nr:hypothetical protein LTR09_002816 [Extremus antarcticus]
MANPTIAKLGVKRKRQPAKQKTTKNGLKASWTYPPSYATTYTPSSPPTHPPSSAKAEKGNLICASPPTRVNHQIRKEFLSVLALSAKRISADVQNFDFAHIITFLNKLNDGEEESLNGAQQPGSRTIEINLTLSNPVGCNMDQLTRWLTRFDDPAKRGVQLTTSVTLTEQSYVRAYDYEEHHGGIYFNGYSHYNRVVSWSRLNGWKGYLDNRAKLFEECKAKEELEKIVEAIRVGLT